MTAPTIEELAARLETQEHRIRLLRWVVIALASSFGLLVAVIGLPGRRSAREISAERLVIRDKEGRVRAALGVDRTGLPGLKLYDGRGLTQIALEISTDDFSTLTFSDRGSDRVVLDSSIEGATSLRFMDRTGQSRTKLFIAADSEAGFRVAGGQGGVTVSVRPDTQPTVLATDAEGREIGRLLPGPVVKPISGTVSRQTGVIHNSTPDAQPAVEPVTTSTALTSSRAGRRGEADELPVRIVPDVR